MLTPSANRGDEHVQRTITRIRRQWFAKRKSAWAIPVLYSAWLVVVASFFVLATQLFVTLIEFKLTTLAGFVLVPFGLFGKTAFLAERVLGNIIASGVKILVLAVIVGIGTNLFSQFTQGFGGNQPAVNDVPALALAALTLLGLGIFGPSIATGIAAGAPQLGAGAAVATASAIYGIGSAAPATVLATGGAAVRAGRGVASVITGRAFSSSNSGNGGPAGGSSPGSLMADSTISAAPAMSTLAGRPQWKPVVFDQRARLDRR
jgi:type IV secretion system protein TrbL